MSLNGSGHRMNSVRDTAATGDAGGARLASALLASLTVELASVELVLVETVDGRIGFGLTAHIDKAKTLATTNIAVGDDLPL